MNYTKSTFVVVLLLLMSLGGGMQSLSVQVAAQDSTTSVSSSSGCTASIDFEYEVWAKVIEPVCLRCHTSSGDAAESELILQRPQSIIDRESISNNCETIRKWATRSAKDKPLLLSKAIGQSDHGGGEVLKPGSAGLTVLERFLSNANQTPPTSSFRTDRDLETPFFENVTMMSDERLLRRITLSLAGRLPSGPEVADVKTRGTTGLRSVVERIMTEQAFYERLKEAFNDILLTTGIEDNAETLLSYDHFEKTRNWIESYDLNSLPEEKRTPERWRLAAVYRKALLREPLELIEYIVKNDKPFTEVVTADYIMVSPYTARGYGIYEEIRDQFKNPDDPFEFIRAKLKALQGRDGKTQESSNGFYPHSGVLSTFHYLRRYPSTETNRNRLRSRMIYQHWLGIDVMALAPRSTDASAVSAKYEIPTMQAPDCVVCHKIIDPVAGLYQNYNFEGHVGPRKEGWYVDMFGPGFEKAPLPDAEKWRAPQWLGNHLAEDPRFAIAMVEHVYFTLFGRKVLKPPIDIEDVHFLNRRRAYREQRAMIEATANAFREDNFNLKRVFRVLIESPFYRADGLATTVEDPSRSMELEDVGIVRILSPEQLERKIHAVFGMPWGRLREEMAILYGGIDSLSVTERIADPSGAMGAVQRLMANDVACYHVAHDFHKQSSDRLLFPDIEKEDLPGTEASDRKIRAAIAYLHQRVLGDNAPVQSTDVEQSFRLFNDVRTEAKGKSGLNPNESYFCGGREEFRTEDPEFTLRAWRAVLTYLLRRREFLYE